MDLKVGMPHVGMYAGGFWESVLQYILEAKLWQKVWRKQNTRCLNIFVNARYTSRGWLKINVKYMWPIFKSVYGQQVLYYCFDSFEMEW